MTAQQLPPAHAGFVEHFIDAIYDVDRIENDEVLPFGTDEGSELLAEWADRVDQLVAAPSLATVLGVHDETSGVGEESADLLIPAGFVVLRYTGTLDETSRRLLLKTIRNELRDVGSDPTLETMRDDLVRLAGGSGKKPRPKPWLIIYGGWNNPPHARWLRRIASAIRADAHWVEWWSASPVRQLHLTVTAAGLDRREVQAGTRGDQFSIRVSSPELSLRMVGLGLTGWRPPDGTPLHEWCPEAAELYLELIVDMLNTTATQLGLSAPPEVPAAVSAMVAKARRAAAQPPPTPDRAELARLWDVEITEFEAMAPPPQGRRPMRNPWS